MKLSVLIFTVFCTAVLMAFEDLGPLKTAQDKYPQIFETGSVNIVTINEIPCYVFSGEAEQAFLGDFAESESELYEEATLSAKSNFYEFLSKKNNAAAVSMTGCGVLYQYNDKKLYHVILFVPQKNVSIEAKKSVPDLVKKEESGVSVPAVEQKTALAAQETIVAPAPVPAKEATEEAPQISPVERRIAKFQNRLKNSPDDVFSMITLADLYKKVGKNSDALKLYCSTIKKLDQNKYFDETEKIRVICEIIALAEETKQYDLALKYCYYLLRHKCTQEQRKKAVASISQLRLRLLD